MSSLDESKRLKSSNKLRLLNFYKQLLKINRKRFKTTEKTIEIHRNKANRYIKSKNYKSVRL